MSFIKKLALLIGVTIGALIFLAVILVAPVIFLVVADCAFVIGIFLSLFYWLFLKRERQNSLNGGV